MREKVEAEDIFEEAGNDVAEALTEAMGTMDESLPRR